MARPLPPAGEDENNQGGTAGTEWDTTFPDGPSDDDWDAYALADPMVDGDDPEPGGSDDDAGEDAKVVDLDAIRAARQATAEEQEALNRRYASDYFVRVDGRITFRVRTMAEDIMAEGPLAVGIDDRMWSWKDGVWKPDKHVVRNRATRLLQERYKSDGASNAEHIVRADLEEAGRVIAGEPVRDVINFRNGFLDWATGTLRDHDPEVLSTVQLSTEWDPDAECPEFEKFLSTIVAEDMVPVVWELIGYLMFSGNPLHKAVMLHGTGRNGKGTLIRVIKELLGEENLTAISLQSLATERFAPANLFNKLANIAGDIDGTYMSETAKFKGITGEDTISAEFKGRDHFEFTPWAVPMFSANKIPGSADVTTGYLARWVVIPFPHDFTGREDRRLTDRLITPGEIRGIAVKGVQALRTLMDRGNFEEPESAKKALEHFYKAVDQVRTWIDECAELGDDWAPVNRTELYRNYKDWAKDGGYGQLRSNEFYDRLQAIGLQTAKVRGERTFKGLKLVKGLGVEDPFTSFHQGPRPF